MQRVDRTSLNIVTILIAGAGLFVVFTKFNVPEMSMSYFGASPYAIKHDIIEGVMAWLFTLLTLAGLLLQVIAEIIGNKIETRSYPTSFYLVLFLVGVVVMVGVVLGLTNVGHVIAKKKWFPEMVANQSEVFKLSKSIIEHNGLTEQELAMGEKLNNPEERRRQNYAATDQNLAQIEKLLEVERAKGGLGARTNALRHYFKE